MSPKPESPHYTDKLVLSQGKPSVLASRLKAASIAIIKKEVRVGFIRHVQGAWLRRIRVFRVWSRDGPIRDLRPPKITDITRRVGIDVAGLTFGA